MKPRRNRYSIILTNRSVHYRYIAARRNNDKTTTNDQPTTHPECCQPKSEVPLSVGPKLRKVVISPATYCLHLLTYTVKAHPPHVN